MLKGIMGPIEAQIRSKLAVLHPTVLEIANDSAQHAHHAGMRGSTNTLESHFRLNIVSEEFVNKPKPARHRMVYRLLAEEMQMPNGVHAVQMTTKTPSEAAESKS